MESTTINDKTPNNKSLKIYQKYIELINYSNDIVRKYPIQNVKILHLFKK